MASQPLSGLQIGGLAQTDFKVIHQAAGGADAQVAPLRVIHLVAAAGGIPEVVQASYQEWGQLQPLVREVGGLPGVRLIPVSPAGDDDG